MKTRLKPSLDSVEPGLVASICSARRLIDQPFPSKGSGAIQAGWELDSGNDRQLNQVDSRKFVCHLLIAIRARGRAIATIFSHIVLKRFTNVMEDVATDALAFILESSEAARGGMMKLLRTIEPNLPDLHFKTQQTEGSIRPDMWGYVDDIPTVYVENKFWAGLTENQPCSYLEHLSKSKQPTLMLVVVPSPREQTMRRELSGRLIQTGITMTGLDIHSESIACVMATGLGTTLAITSWPRLLSILELEAADDPQARSNLIQLRSLCDAADIDAFLPISPAETSDQRMPALILQLGNIVQAVVESAITQKIVNAKSLNPQASKERIGRYVRIKDENGAGCWFGVHFGLWKKYGSTPIWIVFAFTEWGKAAKVRPVLEPWATKKGFPAVQTNSEFSIGLPILTGEEKDTVVRDLVARLREIEDILCSLASEPKPLP